MTREPHRENARLGDGAEGHLTEGAYAAPYASRPRMGSPAGP
jgi:hypothetical protein